MEMLPPYWKWDDAVSLDMCDTLLKERNILEETQARVNSGGGAAPNLDVRNSKVCWAKPNHWIESIMYNYTLYANESAGWLYQMGRPGPVQLTSYGVDSFYGWHEDWAPLVKTPNVRKLSATLLLSDPSEFEGGQFEFADGGIVEMKRGSLIVFPSFLRHQVTPVTKGMRYSAVCWVQGPKTL